MWTSVLWTLLLVYVTVSLWLGYRVAWGGYKQGNLDPVTFIDDLLKQCKMYWWDYILLVLLVPAWLASCFFLLIGKVCFPSVFNKKAK